MLPTVFGIISGKEDSIMAFKTNDSQQYSLTDSMNNFTSRELKALEKSWAKVFAEEIFPAIADRI